MPLPALLAAIPLIGWIGTILLGSAAVWIGTNILHNVQWTLIQLGALAVGFFALYKSVGLFGMKDQSDDKIMILAAIGVILIVLGIPNLIFSAAGQETIKYTIVPFQ
jgi:hypothetical protein